MPAKISFFPVGNGDMTLIELESGHRLLVDLRIRPCADDPTDPAPDVARALRDRLETDGQGVLFVDVLVLTHLHEDHCLGLERHFHLGPPSAYDPSEAKIFIREIWCGAAAFMSWDGLVDDGRAAIQEIERRALALIETGGAADDGDALRIMGGGELPEELKGFLVATGNTVTTVCGEEAQVEVLVLGPLAPADGEPAEHLESMHRWSLVLRWGLAADGHKGAGLFLSGGDAEVAVWERLNQTYDPQCLEYDLLQAPHHCSWRSMSYDSWSEMGENAKVCEPALQALSRGRSGAHIVASSKPIIDADSDPPCSRAKREYRRITSATGGRFLCVTEEPSEKWPEVMEFTVERSGPRYTSGRRARTSGAAAGGLVGVEPMAHG